LEKPAQDEILPHKASGINPAIYFDFGAGFVESGLNARFRSCPNPLRVIPVDFFAGLGASGLGFGWSCEDTIRRQRSTNVAEIS
jgi:hypothetical protein